VHCLSRPEDNTPAVARVGIMPTTPALFRGLIDDAAVFPPGNVPLTLAFEHHLRHRSSAYADCIGPLLVPAGDVCELAALVDAQQVEEPVRIGIIARPGTDPTSVVDAVSFAMERSLLDVVGVEIGWTRSWRDLGLTIPLALEVPRGPEQQEALSDLLDAAAVGAAVIAKFRTGPTASWAWPDERELAAVIAACADDIPFKLTGGLHHAVRGSHVTAGAVEENHGVLNVLIAVRAAQQWADVEEVADLLSVRDGPALARAVGALTDGPAHKVRSALVSYGCCEVTDPVTELVGLGLLPPSHLPKDTR
jgi:hypothetical protein